MTLGSYAKNNCCNWQNSECWISHERADHIFASLPMLEPGACVVAAGFTCEWFKKTLLAADTCPDSVRTAYAARDSTIKVASTKMRSCPDCGAQLVKRQRYCKPCARKRKGKADRESQQRSRQNKAHACQKLTDFEPPKSALTRARKVKMKA